MMLSIEARPQSFKEVAGQSIAKALLKTIASSPDTSPKVIQLYGGFGCGKTTLARIFAAEINHIPYSELSTTPFLQELDSSQLNKDTITTLIESWYAAPTGGYRVIIIDENHLLSKQVQSALLKVLEDMPKNTFIVFATTDYDKVLDTIKSRSLEIKLEQVNSEDMYNNLLSVSERFGVQVDDEVFQRIIEVAHGHMRTAHMNLSKYEMLGKEQYLSLFKSAYSEIVKYFMALSQRNQQSTFSAIDQIMQFPLTTVQDDLHKVLLDTTKSLVTQPNDLAKALGPNTIKLVKLVESDWFQQSFSSDVELQTSLLCLYQLMSEGQAQPTRPAATQVTGARR